MPIQSLRRRIRLVSVLPYLETLRQGRDRRHQFCGVDRFGQMNLKARRQSLHSILRPRIGSQGCGRYGTHPGPPMAPDTIDELKPINVRHPEISNDDIKLLCLEDSQRIVRRARCTDARADGS